MSLPPEYFDELYGAADDPWSFRTRWYEARKRSVTLAALTSARYGAVFEPGCSIGAMSAELARRCDRLLAMDVSAAALERAANGLPDHVTLVRGAVPDDWPDGDWDLVLLSEVGYYLDGPACTDLATRAAASARELVCVHWRHPVADYPLDGDAVHEYVGQAALAAGLTAVAVHLEEDFRLEVWSADGRSVAERTAVPGARAVGGQRGLDQPWAAE